MQRFAGASLTALFNVIQIVFDGSSFSQDDTFEPLSGYQVHQNARCS